MEKIELFMDAEGGRNVLPSVNDNSAAKCLKASSKSVCPTATIPFSLTSIPLNDSTSIIYITAALNKAELSQDSWHF